MFKFNYSKYNPLELISGGGLIHGTSFPFQKLSPKRPGACTWWGLSEFYGVINHQIKFSSHFESEDCQPSMKHRSLLCTIFLSLL